MAKSKSKGKENFAQWSRGVLYMRERAAVICEEKASRQFGKGSKQRIADHLSCARAIRGVEIIGPFEAWPRPS